MAGRTVKYVFTGDVSGLKASLSAAGAGVKKLGDDLTASDAKGKKFRAGMDTVGNAAGKVGLVAAAGLGAVVLSAANFEQAMSNVKAATHEGSAGMEQLRAAAIKAGADTAFSATEAAAGIEALSKAGVSTKDVLGGGLKGALDLAAAGSLDVGDAAEIAATAMTQFKLQGSEVPHIADLLAAAAGKAQGEVSDMGAALGQGGLVASQMGLSIEETTGSLAAFASAGLIGSDAGTSLKTMLLRLANPSAEAAGTMKQLGINAYDAQGKFVGMESIAGQLQTAFKGQSQATRDAAMATIFGSDAIRASSILYTQGAKGIKSWTDKVNDQGYAAETAAIKMDNLKGDVEKLGGSLESAFIGAGSGALGPLRGLVQGATLAANAFGKLPPAAQSAATGVLALTAVTGGGLFVAAKTLSGLANMRQAMTDLGPAGAKAAGAMKALGMAAGGLVALEVAGAAIDALESKAAGSVPGIQATTKALLDLGNAKAVDQFKDLGAALDRQDPGRMQGIADGLNEIGAKGGAAGTALARGVGGFIGMQSQMSMSSISSKAAAKEFAGLDAALANIASTGSPAQAKAALAQLTAAQGLSASQTKTLSGMLPQYNEAMAGAGNSASLAADGATKAAGGVGELGAAIEPVVSAADQLKATLDSLFGVELSQAAATDAWQQSLADLGANLEKTNGQLRGNSQAARDNRGVVMGAVTALQAKTEADQAAGVSGAKLAEGLIKGRNAIVQQAVAAGASRPAIQGYLKTLGLTPKSLTTFIRTQGDIPAKKRMELLADVYKLTPKQVKTIVSEAGSNPTKKKVMDLARQYKLTPDQVKTLLSANDQASAKAKAAKKAIDAVKDKKVAVKAQDLASGVVHAAQGVINSLTGKTVTITTRHVSTFSGSNHGRNAGTSTVTSVGGANGATGGLFTRAGVSRYSNGGPVWGAGTATSDSIDAKLSNGEYVMKAAAVAQYGVDFMQRINQQKYANGGAVGYAGGGKVNRRRGLRNFNLTEDLDTGGIRAEFAELRKAFHLGRHAFMKLQNAAIRVSHAYAKQERRLEDQKSVLSQLQSDQASYVQGVRGAYGTDAFTPAQQDLNAIDYQGNVVGQASAADHFLATMQQNAAITAQALADAKATTALGIDQKLQQELLASGNTELLHQLAGMTAAQVNVYDAAYATQQGNSAQLGTYAGDKAFGPQIAAQSKLIEATKHTLERLDKRIEGIESAVERGARRGMGDRARDTHQRGRAHR